MVIRGKAVRMPPFGLQALSPGRGVHFKDTSSAGFFSPFFMAYITALTYTLVVRPVIGGTVRLGLALSPGQPYAGEKAGIHTVIDNRSRLRK